MTVSLSIVLPAYKEKENLAVLVPQIEAEFQGDSFEIIVVDDHSCMKRFALVTTWCSDTKSPEREKEVQTSHVEHFMGGQRSTSRAHFPIGLSVL